MSSGSETRTGGRPATTGVIRGSYALSVGMPDTPLPKGWRWTALSDVARLETGHTPSRRHPEYWGGDVPWIGIKDATENHGRMIEDTYQHTNELGIANSSARILPTNTVCLSRTASVGYVVVMGRPMATSQDFVNWVCSDAVDYRFLKYVLLAERNAFLRFASGTTHQTIYFPEVKAFHVALPSIREQHAISHILGSLDDRIELNRRMNDALESTTRALFKSWFVDFDTVHAHYFYRFENGYENDLQRLHFLRDTWEAVKTPERRTNLKPCQGLWPGTRDFQYCVSRDAGDDARIKPESKCVLAQCCSIRIAGPGVDW